MKILVIKFSKESTQMVDEHMKKMSNCIIYYFLFFALSIKDMEI